MVAIKKFRKLSLLTQEKLADKIGVAKSTIAMWETGERKPDIIMLKKLAAFFNCTTDDLLEPICINEMEEKENEQIQNHKS